MKTQTLQDMAVRRGGEWSVSRKVSLYRGFNLLTQRVVGCEMQKTGTLS
jgi:hypothetical protein